MNYEVTVDPGLLMDAKKLAEEMLETGEITKPVYVGRAELMVTTDKNQVGLLFGSFFLKGTYFYIACK